MRFRGRHFEPLERRRLMAAVYPSPYEQYMIELYNWARANPSAAATKYGVDLNEGPPGAAITADAKQPLAINPLLDGASHAFAQWMMDHGQFGHYVDGSDPQSRMAAAGYSFTGSYGDAENIEIISSSWGLDPLSTVQSEFQNYYTDGSIDGRWHRVNMMDPTMKEVGSGVVIGSYTGMNAMISVEDFAHSGTTSFLTGVAYTDTSGDNFYTPGEQMGGVTVTAIRASDGATFSTTTWDSGGYSLALPAGTYTVWGGGGTLGGYVKYNSVVIGSTNVKRDFRPDDVNSSTGPVSPPPASPPPASPPPASPPPPSPPPVSPPPASPPPASPPPASPPPASPPPASPPPASPPPDFAQLSNGTLSISGTTGTDQFALSESVGILLITRDGESVSYHVSDVHSIVLSAGNGNDTVTFESGVAIRSTIIGGNGDDVLHGGDAADVLRGGAGNDKLYGGNGDDSLYGDDGNDSLFGQNGNDLLDGRAGADYMSGGKNIDTVDYSSRTAPVYVELTGAPKSGQAGEKDSVLPDVENIIGGSGNDRLIGSSAANSIWGNRGNDSITGNGGADWLWGGNGNDHFYTTDSVKDHINGGNGIDSVSGDLMDSLTSIEFH